MTVIEGHSLERLALTLITVVNNNGGRMLKELALKETMRIMGISRSDMSYVLTFSKAENMVSTEFSNSNKTEIETLEGYRPNE